MVKVHANRIKLNSAVVARLLLEREKHFFKRGCVSVSNVFLFLGFHAQKDYRVPRGLGTYPAPS